MGASLNCIIVRGTREIDLLQIFFANPHSGERHTHTLRVVARCSKKETRRPRYVESFYVPRSYGVEIQFLDSRPRRNKRPCSFSVVRDLSFCFFPLPLSLSLSVSCAFGDFSPFYLWLSRSRRDRFSVFVLSSFSIFPKTSSTDSSVQSVHSFKLRLVPSFVFFPSYA